MRSKFSRVNHFIASARSLRIKPPYPHQYRVLRALKTSSEKFKYGDSIMLRLVVPPSKELRVLQCQTTEELIELVKTYRGTLTEFSGNGFSKIIPRSKYFEVSPHTIYEIISPYFASMMDERQHRQIADKAFEDKSRRALTRYLEEQGLSFRELDRVVQADGKPIAEWEAVIELEDGKIWFLECKHCVSTVFYPILLYLTVMQDIILRQWCRLKKSMKVIGKPVSSGKLFVAGKFWRRTDGDDPKTEALEQGFGILFENGVDLTVVYSGGS